MAEISPLRRRMVDDMMIRNLSPATQQSYPYAVSKFSRYFGRCPDRLSLDDVRAYQLHLIAKQRSWSRINQTVCALRFFYGVTLGRADAFERIVAAREPQKPPVVLSGDEIMRFLEAVSAGRTQPRCSKAPQAQVHRAARDADCHRDGPVRAPAFVLQPQDLTHSSRRHSLGRHRSPSRSDEMPDRSPAQRSGNDTPSRDGRLQIGMADIKWDSVADKKSECVADLPRNG